METRARGASPLDAPAEPEVRRILVVEDNPGDLTLLRLLLAEAGFVDAELSVADSLSSARRHLVDADVDVVLLDLTLPDATGLEAVAALVAAVPATALVVVSGSRDESLVLAALGQGAQDYLQKDDLAPNVLGATVRRAVQRHAAQQRRRGALLTAGQALERIEVPTVAVDGSGTIIACNDAWSTSAVERGLQPSAGGIGTHYLGVCDGAHGFEAESARAAAAGIREVLAGARSAFSLEYPCTGPDGRRWYSMRVSPLGSSGGGAIISHLDLTDLKEAEERLHLSDPTLRPLVDPLGEIVASVAADGTVLSVSPETTARFGIRPGTPLGSRGSSWIHRADRAKANEAFARCFASPRERVNVTVRARTGEGRFRYLEIVLANLLDHPEVGAIVVTGRIIDGARRQAVLDRLRDQLMDRLPAAVIVTDDAGIVLSWNQRAEEIYGWSQAEALGATVADLHAAADPFLLATMAEGLDQSGRWEGEYEARRVDGTLVPVFASLERFSDEAAGVDVVVGASLDLTDRRRLEQELERSSSHDHLTGLRNRVGFLHDVDRALLEASRLLCVLVLDVDDFKLVNDSAGQPAGDDLLKELGASVREAFPDARSVSRISGDEFALALDVRDGADALTVAEQLRAAVRRPIRIGGADLKVRASVGVAVAEGMATGPMLLRQASAATHRAKEAGKDRVEAFDPELLQRASETLAIEQSLVGVAERGELYVAFEPVIRFADGVVTGAEALVRWAHPELGLLAPNRFIGIAERTGAIEEIGEFVLREACGAAVRWRQANRGRAVRVAVNLSARQIMNPATVEVVGSVLEETGLLPGQLVLEITESVLMADPEATALRLAALRALGVGLSVDDFGTGYSSLAYLKQFPIDSLKIDRSFTTGLGSSHEDLSIVTAIVNLAASLGLSVIAEGVESDEHITHLARVGCGYGQGHRWGAGFGADELEALAGTRILDLPPARSLGSIGDETVDALATVEHEVRAPLHVILGYSDVLAEVVEPEHLHFIESIRRSGERIVTMLDTLDDLRSFERGSLELRIEPTNLGELVHSAVTDLSPLLRHEIVVNVEHHVIAAVDPARIHQVLTNLLRNAAKFSPPSEPIEVAVVRRGEFGEVLVADRGPGVAPEDAGRIWRRFSRGDHRLPGSGLGLYVSRGIANAHGGDLVHRTRDDAGGSVFVLTVALADPPS